MKAYKSFAIALFIVAAATTARSQDVGTMTKDSSTDTERHSRVPIPLVVKNYLNCLDSDMPSVIESALGHVTYMRIAFPREDLRDLQEKLVQLTNRGMTRAIRYKAFTAMEVFGDPSAFERFIAHRHNNGDGLLDEIGTRILPGTDLVTR